MIARWRNQIANPIFYKDDVFLSSFLQMRKAMARLQNFAAIRL